MAKHKPRYRKKSLKLRGKRNGLMKNNALGIREPLHNIINNDRLYQRVSLPPLPEIANQDQNETELPEIENEVERNSSFSQFNSNNIGRRIIDVSYFLKSISKINNHPLFGCGFSDMEIVDETKVGLISLFQLKCKMCGINKSLYTEDPSRTKEVDLNSAAVLATISTGCGHSQMIQQQALLNIPQMSYTHFAQHQELVSNAIYETALDVMTEAGAEELQLAKAAGEVDEDGNGLITVIVDGAWCKRSYRVNYDAPAGVACIVGAKTGQLLYVATKHKYCPVCSRAANKNLIPDKHKCSKNWTGSSTSMETQLILEGFRDSIKMHKLKYVRVIGDGDSSVYNTICVERPYGRRLVRKIECTNHLLRNYCTNLRELTKKTKSSINKAVRPDLRRQLSNNILKLRIGIKSAILHIRKTNQNLKDQVTQLSNDIRNCPYHTFGKHDKCAEYFCKRKEETDYTKQMEECGLMQDILILGNRLIQNADSLILNMNNNAAETYNSVVAKFVGGKRINFAIKGGYGVRCGAAAISFNRKEDYLPLLYKKLSNKDPGMYAQSYVNKVRKYRLKRLARGPQIKKKKTKAPADKDYGLVEKNVVESNENNEARIEDFLNSLIKSKEEITDIEKVTRGQSMNIKWKEHRSLLLTSSNFGTVCKLRNTTDPKKTVNNILFSSFRGSVATKWGKDHEIVAKQEFATKYGKKVEECGLFISDKYPYLGASPDGIINSKEIVEIKCPFSCNKISPEMGILEKKIKFLVKDGDSYKLNKKDKYYYQVQGQLEITGADYCYFIAWTPLGMIIDKICRDKNFWAEMEPKLTTFYKKNMIPEFIKRNI